MRIWAFVFGIALNATLTGCGALQQAQSNIPPIGASGERTDSNASNASANETVLYSFKGGSDGAYPSSSPILIGGKLYGATSIGGDAGCAALKGCGTIYELSLRRAERVLYAFKGGTDGEAPNGPLLDVTGNVFGTTVYGGGAHCKSGYANGCGTIFELNASDKERILYRFAGEAKGAFPSSGLTRLKSDFYGELAAGGSSKCDYRDHRSLQCGSVFKFSAAGSLESLYAFKGGHDGAAPAGGVVAFDGSFYGTTSVGGRPCYYFYNGCGTVFRVTPSGAETILHAFRGSWHDGAIPTSGLVVLDGAFYGTTAVGGSHNCGLTYYLPCGTVFKVTPSGKEQIIYNFSGGTDGAFPNGLLAADGKLYGTTKNGGYPCGCGTVFSLTTSGSETILYQFKGGSDAAVPYSGVIYADGTLYGTTVSGGSHNDGAVYAVTP